MQAEADLYATQHPGRGSPAMDYPLGADRDGRRLADSPDAAASRSFHLSAIRIIVWNDAMGVRTFEARPSAKRLSSRGRSSSPLLLPRQRSLSGYHGSKASVFSRRSLTMFAAGFYRQLGAASVQCWYRSDASSFQIGVSGRGRTSLTAERVDQRVGRTLPTLHLDVPT